DPARSPFPFRVTDIDLGDRLWGQNTARVALELDSREAAEQARSARLRLVLTDPTGASRMFEGRTAVIRPPGPGGRPGSAVAAATYEVKRLCRTWTEQYRLSLQLDTGHPGDRLPPEEFFFGTPSRLIAPGVSARYPYPEEPV